ncbi:MAG: ABC transporter permease subunit [Bdellovibrionales bacterium]|nr:ABC transporter permease subunit [Bdellovibrionales bacterium]
MKNIWTIASRDFKSYFFSPIAYIVTAGFLTIMGFMFVNILSYFINQNMRSMEMNIGKGASITEGVVSQLYGNMNVILLFLVPFITMRLFAEEKKNNTIQLLLTAPVTTTEIILGKFLSSMLLVLVMLGFTLIYPIILFLTGNPDLGPIFTSYLGTILLVGCYLAFGLLFSAMTENQIVAGALTFAFSLFLWVINWASQLVGSTWGEILNYLSIIRHYENFSRGVINSADIIFYFSIIGLGVFLTHRVLDSLRWR